MTTALDNDSYRLNIYIRGLFGRLLGDNHKVKIGKKRSKTNGIKLGKMTSGCGCPQVPLPKRA